MSRNAVLNMIQMYSIRCILEIRKDPLTPVSEAEEAEAALKACFDDLMNNLPAALA